MQRTRRPVSASAPPRLTAVVVLPTPPFWLAMARTRVTPLVLASRPNGCAPPSRYHTEAAAARRGGCARGVALCRQCHGRRRAPARPSTGAWGAPLAEVERVKPRAMYVEEAIGLALESRWA